MQCGGERLQQADADQQRESLYKIKLIKGVRKMKKVISLVLVVITVLSVFTITSSAISWPSFSRSVPIKVYTISTGNNTTAYSSSSLSSKKGTIYASDEIYIEKIGRNSNGTYYAYGSYPISSGRKYAYIPLSVITKASAPSEKITAKTSATTYRRASTSNTYGSIDKGDYVYKLATSGNYTQVLYNVGSKSNPSAWKMAWVKTSVYNSMKGTSSSSSTASSASVSAAQSAFNTVFGKNSFDPIWPCSNSGDYVVTTLYYYRYYNNGAKHGCKWSYKNAIDIAGVGGNIVAIEDGTVELASNSYGGFGKCVIIKHNNGTKSLYGHLKSISVSQGQKVSRGQKIGVMGSTGNSTGTHLHFELNNADPFMEYYNDKYAGKIKIDTDVYGSAKEHRNSDSVSKTLYNLINSSYKKVNGYYVHK